MKIDSNLCVGDKNRKLSRLNHWPEDLDAIEGVWRDYYTGDELDNYTRPWAQGDQGTTDNCVTFFTNWVVGKSWQEWLCRRESMGCPCTFKRRPILHLRGFCPYTSLEISKYTPFQLSTNPTDIIMVGQGSSMIAHDSSLDQWIISNYLLGSAQAKSDAKHHTYALGKHNWTITNDTEKCSGKESSYTIEMKLTGCNESQFTCDDGQCVSMEERCNQLPNCRDESDENGCEILILKQGYKKRVPPITSADFLDNSVVPVPVKVSLTLFKVVAIHEEDHSISLQFQITLEWRENRATYHNLKKESYLNALSFEEINKLWLPLVVFTNTDQQETTRLGENWEWTTDVLIQREGQLERSRYRELDEIEIFKGEENSLLLVQSYTYQFQCVYQLEMYPFDTQVGRKATR